MVWVLNACGVRGFSLRERYRVYVKCCMFRDARPFHFPCSKITGPYWLRQSICRGFQKTTRSCSIITYAVGMKDSIRRRLSEDNGRSWTDWEVVYDKAPMQGDFTQSGGESQRGTGPYDPARRTWRLSRYMDRERL